METNKLKKQTNSCSHQHTLASLSSSPKKQHATQNTRPVVYIAGRSPPSPPSLNVCDDSNSNKPISDQSIVRRGLPTSLAAFRPRPPLASLPIPPFSRSKSRQSPPSLVSLTFRARVNRAHRKTFHLPPLTKNRSKPCHQIMPSRLAKPPSPPPTPHASPPSLSLRQRPHP